MNKTDFFNMIYTRVSDYYGEDASVSMHDVMKNNGTKKNGLCVTLGNSNCGPTIYLDEMYEDFMDGKSVDFLVGEIIKAFDEHTVRSKVDLDFFKDFDKKY